MLVYQHVCIILYPHRIDYTDLDNPYHIHIISMYLEPNQALKTFPLSAAEDCGTDRVIDRQESAEKFRLEAQAAGLGMLGRIFFSQPQAGGAPPVM